MLRKWKIFWIGFALLGLVHGLTLVSIPFHRASTTGVFRGLPSGLPPNPDWNENYFLYYVDGVPYTCQRGLWFPFEPGDEVTIVYNSSKPFVSYHYSFVNFGLLVSVPFLIVQFIWLGFILRVYDPLLRESQRPKGPVFSIDDYQKMRRRDQPRQLGDD